MKSIEIKSTIRENTGKTSTISLRKEDNVPCVLYGGKEVMHFFATEISFKNLVYTAAAHTVVLDFGDKKVNAILQDIQFHPVSDKILHADFYELHDDKPITMEIPVILSGTAPGVLNSGGVLRRNKRKLKVKAIPAKLPDSIDVDISSLELGDKYYTSQVESEDFEILHSDNTVICQVRTSRASMASAEVAKDAEVSEDTESPEAKESQDSVTESSNDES
ncbi:MAG: 50S ribosomal protein L25/general stress protein Ctc [Bacteroidetes bacterium]|nr:50S ribosomal protein L25/general stress protein Ctc [Bacteroidota bacterium]MDA0885754.1 50S ribosomal protein L25/general stress protein Ctc [Bacteroidota bacterium]MDA1225824.1 50S ribosomal protein L25/general stress protein Ctc [Bacteroidota bacterium]